MSTAPTSDARFSATHWSLILAAASASEPSAQRALDELCRIYWYPLYAYARRSGNDPEQARDLTQGFFAHLLKLQLIARADENRGKFRSFLLKSFTRFMGDERDRQNARKRGGGMEPISLDAESAETRYSFEPADEQDAARIFERRWAVTLIETTLDRLETEFKEAGKAK
jgi:RNA polymerase sigma-70 factor (ECF subfamily)